MVPTDTQEGFKMTALTINKLSGQAQQFAIACYDMNSIDELELALTDGANESDMAELEITADEWKMAITAALNDLLADQE